MAAVHRPSGGRASSTSRRPIARPVLRADPRRARGQTWSRSSGRTPATTAAPGERRSGTGRGRCSSRPTQASARSPFRFATRAAPRRCCGSPGGRTCSSRASARARRGARARPGRRPRPQPGARLLHGGRVWPHVGPLAARAGLRRADAGGRRPHLHHGGTGTPRRAGRRVPDRPGDRDLGRARRPRSAPRARADGRGCVVDVSLYETAIGYVGYHLAGYLADGTVPTGGARFPMVAPYEVMATRDGELDGGRRQRPSLSGDLRRRRAPAPRRRRALRTNPDRVRDRDEATMLPSPG